MNKYKELVEKLDYKYFYKVSNDAYFWIGKLNSDLNILDGKKFPIPYSDNRTNLIEDEFYETENRNFIRTVWYAISNIRKTFISEEWIKEIYMQLVLYYRYDGYYREDEEVFENKNYIERKYWIKLENIEEELKYLIEYFNDNREAEECAIVKAAIIYHAFISISPFVKCNELMAAILSESYLYKKSVIEIPFLYNYNSLDNQFKYFKNSNYKNKYFEKWIYDYMTIVVLESRRVSKYVYKLNDIYKMTNIKLKELIKDPKKDDICDFIFQTYGFTKDMFAEKFNISFSQASRYINVLEKEGLLISNKKQRGKIFYLKETMDLLKL